MFVFGCVIFARAETTDNYVYGEDSYIYIDDTDPHIMAICVRNGDRYDTIFVTNLMGRIAFLRKGVNGNYSFCMYTENMENSNMSMMIYSTCSFPKNGKYYSGFGSSSGPYNSYLNGVSYSGELVSSNAIIFEDIDDLNTYLNTGEINNPIYQPTGYDADIPTPKNLEVYFDRKLNKPFSLSDLCNPLKIKWVVPDDEDYSDYTLDVQIDVNYNKLNSISGIGTKPTVLNTGKVEFASCSATDRELNISSTYDGWTRLSEKYELSVWGITGNYFDIWLRYKDSVGNYGNWVKVTINPDNSSTVVKSGFFENGTSTTINKGYEEISGDNESHVSGDYDNYYVNTYDDTSLSSNLTSLKSNYSNLVSFYREFFGFLPSEIWIILIGLVSTMALIAILKFVRG